MTSVTNSQTELSEAIAKETSALRNLKGLMLNIASISDIHLNHPNTPTEMIIRNLMTYAFPDIKSTHDLNIIFIGGDVTDSLMDFASENAVMYRKWVASFLWMCAKNDIMVRIIEGTPLHDWGQSGIFIEENENHSIGCDVKYITDIHIEHNERYGIDVLYIPDEIRPSTAMTWKRVEELMLEKGLTQVDYAVMHGAFGYQLPDIAELKDKVHDEEKYSEIVRHYIFIGHVHQHRPNGKIIPNGSFDRLAQGEEGIKGHVRLLKGSLEFIPNQGAMRYFQLDVCGKAPDEIIELVNTRLKGSQDKFKILLLANQEDVAFGIIRRLSGLHPYGEFDVKRMDKMKQRKERQEIRANRASELPVLTRDNLMEELAKEIRQLDPNRADTCIRLVETIAHAVK